MRRDRHGRRFGFGRQAAGGVGFQPVSPRSRDERCPSDSYRGEGLADVRRPADDARAHKMGVPLRQPVERTRKERPTALSVAPDSRKLGWCQVEALVRAARLAQGRNPRRPPGFWESTRRMGPPPRPEESSKPSASWGCRFDHDRPGLDWFVVVLVGCSDCRNRRGASASSFFGGWARRSKPDRNAGPVAGSPRSRSPCFGGSASGSQARNRGVSLGWRRPSRSESQANGTCRNVRREHFVDGRRPGFYEAVPLTRRRWSEEAWRVSVATRS